MPYIQHNPMAPDGPEAFIEFMTAFRKQNPDAHLDIRSAIAEDDLVATHSQEPPATRSIPRLKPE